MWLNECIFWANKLNNNKGGSVIWMPGALLVDICSIPVLGAFDIASVCFNYMLKPVAQVAIKAFNLDPSKILEACGNFVVFTAPIPALGGMGYVAYSFLSNRSMLDDAKFVASSLSQAFEPVLGNKATLCALAVSFGTGVAITKFLSSDSGKGQACE